MLAASAFQSGFRILYPGIKRNPDARQPYSLFGNLQEPGIWESAKYAMDARDKTCGTTFRKESAGMRNPHPRQCPRNAGIRLVCNGAQAVNILQNNTPALAGNQSFFLKAGKDAADGFLGKPQISAA